MRRTHAPGICATAAVPVKKTRRETKRKRLVAMEASCCYKLKLRLLLQTEIAVPPPRMLISGEANCY
jgi:hypothetical protein